MEVSKRYMNTKNQYTTKIYTTLLKFNCVMNLVGIKDATQYSLSNKLNISISYLHTNFVLLSVFYSSDVLPTKINILFCDSNGNFSPHIRTDVINLIFTSFFWYSLYLTTIRTSRRYRCHVLDMILYVFCTYKLFRHATIKN